LGEKRTHRNSIIHELPERCEVSFLSPRSPREEAGPLKGSPVSVRLRPGVRLSSDDLVPGRIGVPDCSVSGCSSAVDLSGAEQTDCVPPRALYATRSETWRFQRAASRAPLDVWTRLQLPMHLPLPLQMPFHRRPAPAPAARLQACRPAIRRGRVGQVCRLGVPARACRPGRAGQGVPARVCRLGVPARVCRPGRAG
jgi:hypothetical protein